MPRNRFGLQFTGWEEMITKLDDVGGSKAMTEATDLALKKSKEYVNQEIDKVIDHLPAGGKYSTGRTKESLDKKDTVDWQGLKASVDVGFNFKKSGLTSIFLMYGTPKMRPVAGLKDAIYGAKSKKEVAKIQKEIIQGKIIEIMEGK